MASVGWQRRNAAARAKGYRNYYDYRMHRYGTRPADEPVPPGQGPRLRGHRGPGTLRGVLRRPERVALVVEIPEADRKGVWTHMRYVVTFTDGDIREYRVRIDSGAQLDEWRDVIFEADVDFIEYVARVGHGVAAAA